MLKPLSLVKSSLHDIRCCDETVVTVVNGVSLGYRAQSSSLACVISEAEVNTGKVHVATLEQYNLATGQPTGVTKPNTPGDGDYIADYPDSTMCAVSQPQPSYGYASINNYVVAKGYVEIVATEQTKFLVPNAHISQTIGSGITTLNITTYAVNDNTNAVACVIEINGLLAESNGYISIPNVQMPFTLNVRPLGYQPDEV